MKEKPENKEQSSKKSRARYVFIVLGVVFIFLLSMRPPTDPDMGWHLGHGKYLEEHNYKVAAKDIFSYSMVEFPLIMHEWTSDVLMQNIYTRGNFFCLSVFFALVTAVAFITATLGVKARTEYKLIAAILGVIASFTIIGVRAQMFSLLGLAVTVFIIFKFRQNPKTRLIRVLPLLFLIWVNVHGGFAVGLFFIGVFLGLEYLKNILFFMTGKFRNKNKPEIFRKWLMENSPPIKSILNLSVILALSFLATLVNPYGWRIYIEVVTTIFDTYTKSIIGEWLPVNAMSPTSFQFMTYLTLLGILLAFTYKKIDFTYLAIAAVFLYLAFSSWRHLPLFMIISIPLWVSIVENLAGTELLKIIEKKWFLSIFFITVALTCFQRWYMIPYSYSLERLSFDGQYPLGAVKYLKEHPKSGNLFNEYNWGGYLVWQYPERKLYIDGRMPSWKIGDFRIFKEFNQAIRHEEGWEEILKKYDVSQALVYNHIFNEVAFKNIGWSVGYQDNLSAVFERPDN